jgi:hypothetical protein
LDDNFLARQIQQGFGRANHRDTIAPFGAKIEHPGSTVVILHLINFRSFHRQNFRALNSAPSGKFSGTALPYCKKNSPVREVVDPPDGTGRMKPLVVYRQTIFNQTVWVAICN